ncbi:putative 3-methyladenine DNA glycosylase isoform X2 [Linepithema humile]|uniref:putative 3-methyladenine DNA glycosylase isoform X2 n=1 Tax=Linepithema humile TaxID=83485 RepID=UPI0006236BD9|nr:PREDICTED: DNA-3-methyladenine glycosylase-like isoform X2 [Linepithema humile]
MSTLFPTKLIHFRATKLYKTIGFVIENKLMKRTRTNARIQQQNTIEKDKNDKEKQIKIQAAPTATLDEKPKLNFKSLQRPNSENAFNTISIDIAASFKKFKSDQQELETEIKKKEKLKPTVSPGKGKLRSVVDLQMMKDELSSLEDPPVTPWEKELSSGRLQYKFFDVPCEELAQKLLGKVLVRHLENGTILKGRIVETEGYLGAVDKASHSYQNKVTPRNLPMYMPPGTIYIYMTYGMYHCFNISSQGDGCAVLVRALDPLEGVECMSYQRSIAKTKKNGLKPHELCNGPSKLCIAYQLNKQYSKYSICTWKSLWIEDDGASEDFQIIKSSRIGIDSCGAEWAKKPLRYYIYNNKSVSKRDKKAEMEIS